MVERPYFDDERTVLTARPVIPLQRIDTKVKHRRRWFIGGAFVAAMLLGAASALVSAYLKIRSTPDPEIQTQSVLPVLPEAPEPPVVEVVPPQRPTPEPIRNTDKTDRVVISPRRSEDEDEDLRRIRDAVLVDEWQERRQRRVERREERRERRRAGRSGRDLSNLDEIFEGRRRPY
ncbi:MAG: hypothetical protein LC794_14435 [Acidobacteria bacterium]|nr:hypothetical protein [Acidobacteriota bacterium]